MTKRLSLVLLITILITTFSFTACSSSQQDITYPRWEQVTTHAEFSPRDSGEGVIFNGEMWLTNGWESATYYPWDLWKSSDGENWTKIMDEPPGKPYSKLIVFKEKMWSFGTDVYSSTNGTDWTLENTEIPCSIYGIVEFENKLWAYGHSDSIWCTADGLEWQRIVEHAPFGKRYTSEAIAYDNKLWLLGGIKGTDDLTLSLTEGIITREVWCSSNGAD